MPSKDEEFSKRQERTATFSVDETCQETTTATTQYLLETDENIEVHPITPGNKLELFNCGEEGFNSIKEDISAAKYSVDIICWGFDPGMCLTRGSPKLDKKDSDGKSLEDKAEEFIWNEKDSYGKLLEDKAKEGIKVRLLLWFDAMGSEGANNIVGITDQPVSFFSHPLIKILRRVSDKNRIPAYANSNADGSVNQERNQYCVDWWKRNLPDGKANPNNPNLQILLRNPDSNDAKKALAFEEDQPEPMSIFTKEGLFGADEKGLETKHPSHHQKPVLIDYPGKYGKGAEQKDGAKEPVGYVMGLNSVSDYWDTAKHKIDDKRREATTCYAEDKEKEHDVLINTISDEQLQKKKKEIEDKKSKGLKVNPNPNPNPNNLPNSKDYKSPVAYHRLRPYQDYACRIQGQALASVHANFELGWCAAEGKTMPADKKKALLEVPKGMKPKEKTDKETDKETDKKTENKAAEQNVAKQVQIVCTQPHEQVGGEPDRSIKAMYYQSVKFARYYIFIENQYFFYPAFARHLKRERLKFIRAWMRCKGEQSADNLPQIYLFIVLPTPENNGMVPRTYQTFDELGVDKKAMDQQSDAYGNMFKHEGAKIAEQDPDFKQQLLNKKERDVLDHASVDNLKQVLGMQVSVATLKTSGKNKNGEQAYREIYIHAKLMMLDDMFMTVGSANLDQRSMAVDSEINIAATGSLIGDWRQKIFAQHYGDGYENWKVDHLEPQQVADGFEAWNKRMDANKKAKGGGTDMQGFLLPFVDHRAIQIMVG